MTPPIDEGPVGVDYDPAPDAPKSVVEEVMMRHEGQLMRRNGVTGVGIGQNAIGDAAIVVYLQEKSAVSGLPKQLDGIDVVTEITGAIDAQY